MLSPTSHGTQRLPPSLAAHTTIHSLLTLPKHAGVAKVHLEVSLWDVLGPLSQLIEGVDPGLALGLPRLGLLHNPGGGQAQERGEVGVSTLGGLWQHQHAEAG